MLSHRTVNIYVILIWMKFLNRFLSICLLAVIAATAFLWFSPAEIVVPQYTCKIHRKRPKNGFRISPSAYSAIGKGPLHLVQTKPTIQLPDLRTELLFYGVNARPDASFEDPLVHLAFKDGPTFKSIRGGERCYLKFEQGSYAFSDEETNLWIVADTATNGKIHFHLGLLTHDGKEIDKPAAHASFTLPLIQTHGRAATSWDLGNFKVDNSLLARMRTRWYGEDLFLADHGGEEFAIARGRERIDFGEGCDLYSCFLALGESLIWKEGRWHTPLDNEDTSSYPLLHLRKRDHKLMILDLYDVEGRAKLSLSIMRARSGCEANALRDALRFVAAKTWSQFVLEAGTERIEVSPGDWLLFDGGGVRKLSSLSDIDSYVAGTLSGELMVIEKLARKEGRRLLCTHIYNATRNVLYEHEIPLTSNKASPPAPITHPVVEQKVPAESLTLSTLPQVIRGMIEEISET